jgi:hypothetical protein|tara:strand:+ start:532 stop:744 length:213 start_codon:yes stop_codon:yes gene_type:complete
VYQIQLQVAQFFMVVAEVVEHSLELLVLVVMVVVELLQEQVDQELLILVVEVVEQDPLDQEIMVVTVDQV